ncbi:pentapeptide repeat-containing protein [Streptomyces sp. IGB124]|uniref:pentapeptide repeat-containing protein n=1 Tax=Streptomyces sp. IGB124 TaxID=1519485 RepID=UPI00131B6F87|nr:pentapeptide repeat-containing protein [Streptomyces sp. IGB124]
MAALAAVLFSWIQVEQASTELRISDAGQITNRFNSAITNLGAKSEPVRIGGIYALHRILQDSPRDNVAVTSVLAAYIRERAPLSPKKQPRANKADISAALTVLASRPESFWQFDTNLRFVNVSGLTDEAVPLIGNSSIRNFFNVDLSNSDLHGALLARCNLKYATLDVADFSGGALVLSDLSGARARSANFSNALLSGSNFSRAHMEGVNLTDARLGTRGSGARQVAAANLTDASLQSANLTRADLRGVNRTRAVLNGANLTDANLAGASLRGANLANNVYNDHVSLNAADLGGADLRGVDFSSADLRGADLSGAKLPGAQFKGAKVDKNTRGMPAS